jgi:hypothetical protein
LRHWARHDRHRHRSCQHPLTRLKP